EFYFDDLNLDPGFNNLSSAVGNQWAMVNNFEGPNALDTWTFIDVMGGVQTESPQESIQWVEELSGNRYLHVQATHTSGKQTISYHPLPGQVEVSDVVTL